MGVQVAMEPTISKEERFDCFWTQHGEWVEEPNQRRGGESGVQRVIAENGRLIYVKRQVGHTYRSWLHPFGRPTVLRERDALEGLSGLDVSVPKLIFCGAQRDKRGEWRALLVTAALDGFEELENWYAGGGRDRHGEALHDQLLEDLAINLARMHLGRWQHSCLYMKHVFVRVTGEGEDAKAEVALLDLEKCRRRLTPAAAARHDLKQLRRHSSFTSTDWQKLVYFYQAAFGSAIKGLD
ncbi:lipopolysaccharide kinase InaA family protein [Pseudomonas quasicaspiana]|uniref:lipopolysaccharide kinase InaA family protein n=1 Tax=Pseudomonas quasicaspiana TaxID=2829821 RepID=UPI001E421C2A|nr:lipopolysaccharide kinase InaA family protein [Pseudomonas quasicaspiana]MCD5971790.1 InaA protein [Pseudomonas quasicaspiana]